MPETSEAEKPKLAEFITRAGLVTWSLIGVLGLLWIVMLVISRTQVLVAPLVLSVALIYILNPLVNRLVKAKLPRFLASIAAFLLFIGALVVIGFLLAPSIVEQTETLSTDFPTIYADTTQQVEDLGDRAGVSFELWTYDELQTFVNDPENQESFLNVVWDRIGAVTSGLFEAIFVFFLAPVVAIYLLMDLPRLRNEAVGLIPIDHREEVVYVSRRLGAAIGGFLRGQVFVALIVGVLMSIGFRIINLEFWLIVGMIAGFLNIIPFVGPWVGGTLGVIVALVTGDGDIQLALLAALVALAVQQIDNNFVSPTVLRATVALHPAAVILVLILGGAVGGFWGLILAVPATAAIKIVAGHLWRTRVLDQPWEEAARRTHEPAPMNPAAAADAQAAAVVDEAPIDPDEVPTTEIEPISDAATAGDATS